MQPSTSNGNTASTTDVEAPSTETENEVEEDSEIESPGPYSKYRNAKTIVDRLLEREATWSLYGNYHYCCWGWIVVSPVRSWWWLLELLTITVTATFIYE